jgi:glycosyltransferase involved in cell wall biosynthesis
VIVQPTVSIIVPTFNRLKYLRAAIDSVFEQTFQDWELIIADDGSDGETLDYLRELEHRPRVKLIRLAHSGNPPAVRNAALRAAKGEYIAFLDSDDVWMGAKLEAQLASLRGKPARRWSYTGVSMVDGSLNSLARPIPFSAAAGWVAGQLLNIETTIAQSSVLVRRELIEETGAYDESLPICGDYELWVRFALRAEVDCIDRPLVSVRRHADHYCDDVTACKDFARALDKIERYVAMPSLLSILRRRRAIAAATLARSQVASGRRIPAVATLFVSANRAWPYQEWRLAVAQVAARTFLPEGMLNVIRKARQRRRGAQL